MTQSTNDIDLKGSIWFTVGDQTLGGSSRIDLLGQIGQCGSITQAAKAVGMSYKGAWDAIDAMNNLAGEPLVERLAGGKGGGGTRLTPRGNKLVEHFRQIELVHQRFVAQLAQQTDQCAQDFKLIQRMAMKTSARNQFFGQVVSIRSGAVNDEVTVQLPAGQTLVATITKESTESLNLKPGVSVFALVKSSSVVLASCDESAQFSARNQLRGTVIRVQAGAVSSEVVLDLGDGLSIAAIITNESQDSMSIHEGQTMLALFKAASVILAVSA